MSWLRRIALAAVLSAAFGAEALADTALPPVRIDSGLIAGTTRDGVNRFFGIPFTAPPVGDLRWQPPQPVTPWKGVKDASAFGPVCPQTADWIHEPQSEDCLRLNIWAPAKPGKYPVMVWIHGGAFTGGSGSQSGPGTGDSIVAHDVILVTINYRLGVLGFYANPELSAKSPNHASGNQGILDQIAALEWVKRNIAAFGGDPNRVTIFGESAGGGAVGLLTMSPLAKGLFHRAIAQSGVANTLPPKAGAEQQGADFAKAHGSLADLSKMDAQKLIREPWETEPNNDGYALTENMADTYVSGRHNMVPIMTGWNSDEGRDLAPAILGKPITADKYRNMVTRGFGSRAPQILQTYPARNDSEAEASAIRLQTDMMGFSAYRWATQQTSAKGAAPAYMYFFVHWPAEPLTPCGAFGCRAGHSAEIRFAFNQLSLDPRPWTADDKLIADRMVRYWTNFAKTGDPNGEGLPKWPAFDGSPESVTVLGTDAEIKERGAFPDFRPYLTMGFD